METIVEPGAKTGVTRTFASCGTPVTVTDPCWATAAEVASRRVRVILATVARAVTAWSGDETGAAASLIATGTDVRGDTARDIARDPARDTGYTVATKDPLEAGPGSGVP
jgi:hypothetical protein